MKHACGTVEFHACSSHCMCMCVYVSVCNGGSGGATSVSYSSVFLKGS